MTETQLVQKLKNQGHMEEVIDLCRVCWLIGHMEGMLDSMKMKTPAETVEMNEERLAILRQDL